MKLKKLDADFTVCKVEDVSEVDLSAEFCFFAKTDKELSLVCPVDVAPLHTVAREDGWRGFRIEGTLDFSLVGILSRISTILAENNIGIFAISTYDTDYIFVKEEKMAQAVESLKENGCRFL